MNTTEIIKRAMQVRGMTQDKFSKEMGYSNQSGVARILNGGGNLRVDNAVKMLNALGYKIMVVDSKDGTKFAEITDKYRTRPKPKKRKMHLTKDEIKDIFPESEELALRKVTENVTKRNEGVTKNNGNVTQNVTRNVTSVTHVTDEQKMNKNEVVQNTSNEQKSASNEQENSRNEVLKIPEFQYGGGSVTKSNGMRYEK